MTAPLIRFEGASLGYGSQTILRDLDLTVQPGDFLGIVGPNGSGKTTILRGILGLLEPTTGQMVRDDDLHFGYVPQRQTVDLLFPLSVEEVVLMGRYRRIGWGRRPRPEDRRAARDCLESAGVGELATRQFRHLSGGQKQRTLIARALVSEPDVLVLDEPTSGMDLGGETAVMSLLEGLHRERSLTILMVSHQLNTLVRWVRQLGFLHRGHLVTGPLEEVLTDHALQELYGPGVRVRSVDGRFVILPGGSPA